MSESGLGRVETCRRVVRQNEEYRILKDPYFGRVNSILSCLTVIAEKNVLLLKRSFAFSHSQGHKQKSKGALRSSAVPPKPDIRRRKGDVPNSDMTDVRCAKKKPPEGGSPFKPEDRGSDGHGGLADVSAKIG